MKRFTMFATLALAVVFAVSSFAGELPRYTRGDSDVLIGGNANFAKASRDTQLLMGPAGSVAPVIGNFEDAGGNPAWNGWTPIDVTQKDEPIWHVDTYKVVSGTYSAWCGEIKWPACTVSDPEGGYANDYNEMLEWRGTVADNALSCNMTIQAVINHNSEGGFDFFYVSVEKFDQGFTDLFTVDGLGLAVAINVNTTYGPSDYMGTNGDEVVVLFRGQSDGAWSDSDCLNPTDGLAQLDDVVITMDNGTGYSHDFEDNTLGDFTVRFPNGVGNFGQLWSGLEDADPCARNYSPQVAFIDDGLIVPGTGGTPCVNWCYGPSGFIVNTTGGISGSSDNTLHTAVLSPVMEWTRPDHDGANLTFTVYRHEDLSPDAPGIFYTWGMRSTASGDPADLENTAYADRNLVYYGGPDYQRATFAVRDLLAPGRTHVDLRLAAYEYGWVWGWAGNDGYPAPYFDNVRFETFPAFGPGLATREIDLANDNFPAIGSVNTTDLSLNSVRFDMANNISPSEDLRNDPGDSVAFDGTVVRFGAVLARAPRLYYKIQPANTGIGGTDLFAAYRTAPGLIGTALEGYVECDTAKTTLGAIVPDRWFGDLPDENFLFPGDVMHYYLEATDDLAGDQQSTTLPADITGFDNFDDDLVYSSSFTINALPTLIERPAEPGVYDYPRILFWNDFANRGGQAEWYGAFRNLGLLRGRDFDEYYTNAPSSGLGNGLGGRASQFHLEGYSDMLYTAGDLSINTIANGDFENDPGKDAEVLDLWLSQGGKDLLLTGDDLASDLNGSGATTLAFMQTWMTVSVASNDIRPLIGGQSAPVVLPEAGNPVFTSADSWIAYGGCGVINTFDAVETAGTGVRLAQFADASGVAGGYPYSAATLNEDAVNDVSVISMPYDFMFIYTDPNEGAKADAPLSARVRVLQDILGYFGITSNPPDVSGVPGLEKFAARNYPNPFNPVTKIETYAPKAGHLSLKIYNVRGELVKTLIDGNVAQGLNTIEWNGTNNAGGKVSSGVYFYEARMGNDVQINKMALVK